ncbi:hypothetical protein HAX54_053258 [Datura stramonium]|uniref:Alpha N-terminal protein methyltransferase 1 n=1 Tax=Datura stramonium TaxID=4076 RepID=A0ABS8T0R4_DATST|nr:hypothetical protein [Datura stramonium]
MGTNAKPLRVYPIGITNLIVVPLFLKGINSFLKEAQILWIAFSITPTAVSLNADRDVEEVGDGDPRRSPSVVQQRKGINYWEGVEATVDGVLGGYGHVNAADIKASEDFLNAILDERFPVLKEAARSCSSRLWIWHWKSYKESSHTIFL